MAGFGTGGGGFSGFGGGQQQQGGGTGGFGTGSGFGGGAGGNTGAGFGSNSSPFGGGAASNTSGGGLFGTSGGFGSGGFGSNNQPQTQTQTNPMFGSQNRGGFGSSTSTTSGGGLFGSGSNTATTGGAGFGAGAGGGGFGSGGSGGTGSAFGTAGNTGGTMFGSTANKSTGFGSSTPQQGTSNSMFGGGTGATGGTGGGFGASTGAGFGGTTGTALGGPPPPSEGTAGTPFNPHTEKDGSGGPGSITSHYQSINCMPPYAKYSFEELRVGDYAQGRRYGNASNQAGAFGNSAFGGGGGFGQQQQQPQQQQNTGGFGSGGGGFGATSSAPSGFGGQTQTAGFGSTGSTTTTTNPLFGSKPANSGLFGQQQTASPAQSGGFGTAGNTGGGFGGATGGAGFGAGAAGGSNLLGGNTANQQQQNKPFGGGTGGFGSSFGQTSSASTPFGGTAATTTPFGGAQQQQQQPQQQNSGLFGSAFGQTQNQQNQAKPPFGGAGAGFGTGANQQQQQQPGSNLFNTGNQQNTGSGLFGGANQQQQQQQQTPGSSMFGAANQQAGNTGGGGGLFGGANQQQEQKPGGLFGSAAPNTGGGFGLGGQQQNQQGGGLFGGANQQQQKPNLWGTSGTSSIMGQNNNMGGAQNNASFGGMNQSQQPQGMGLGNSFGASQQNQQQPPHPSSFQASLLDSNPYGNQSIFSGQPPSNVQSPGPLATPLSASTRQKQRTPLPMYKITPNGANRLLTPPKRQGYGFSYSTYGTPSSASSVSSTPTGLSGSLLGGSLRGGSLGRSFGKSVSTSNLRKSFDPEHDSILAPGAFSAGSSRYSNGGSLKRLTIDRSLRTDLFSRPQALNGPAITNGTNGEEGSGQAAKLKKRVSFETSGDSEMSGAVVPMESHSPEPTPEELGYLRSSRANGQVNGQVNGTVTSSSSSDTANGQPEMEQVRGNELAVVPEDGESSSRENSRLSSVPIRDPKPGEYYMRPSREQLRKMSRDQLKHVTGFSVGRQSCGMVTFDSPVDLTAIDLDNVFDTLVKITVRSITVYPDNVQKPPRGIGFNVPSTLRLENSWPRGRDRKSPSALTSGPIFDKHVLRLRSIKGTEFVDYEAQTGTWVFKVPHFTTYGLDYDDDDEGESFDQSTLSAAPDTATPKVPCQHQSFEEPSFVSEQNTTMSLDVSSDGSVNGLEDDTFEFKKRKLVPGSFGNQEEDGIGDDEDQVMISSESEDGSFLEDGSAGSTISETGDEEEQSETQETFGSEIESDDGDEMDMAGSFPTPHLTAEQITSGSPAKSRLNDTLRSTQRLGTPTKTHLDLSGDWTEQLQRTISPRKQDRAALREVQGNAVVGRNENDTPKATTATTGADKGFATSIDLMNSLFRRPGDQAQPLAKKQQDVQAKGKGFEWPYSKTPKTFAGREEGMDETEVAFHDSFKPRWGPRSTLICPKSGIRDSMQEPDQPWEDGRSIVSEGRSVSLLKFKGLNESSEALQEQKDQTEIRLVDNVPFARLTKTRFHRYAELTHGSTEQSNMERRIWRLSHILFNDAIEDDISAAVPQKYRRKFNHRIKKDRLTRVWEEIIRESYGKDIDSIKSPEERAVAYLCSHRIDDACKTLVESGNLHLATLIPQIGRDETTKADMAAQIESWRKHNIYSEMSEPIRVLYELLAGNAVRSEGRPSGALEDRASTFSISERFGLDWIQAFGLRLWYGITENEPIEAAVAKFQRDLLDGGEPAYPYPWHVNGEKQMEVEEGRRNSDGLLESPLWVVLKVYAAAMAPGTQLLQPISLPAAVLPEAVAGNLLSNRLSFLLHHSLYAIVGQHHAVEVNTASADQLVWDYAWELTSTNQFHLAVFVLMHLSKANCRERAVKEVLARFAAELPTPVAADGSPQKLWMYFTNDLRLPEAWLWVAKALHARDTGNAADEVNFLIRGKNWNEAHSTFCRVVGPSAVIARDYDTLRTLINGFGDSPERKVRDWNTGGAIYEDFLRLVPTRGGRRDRDRAALKRLVDVLVSLGEDIERDTSATGQGLEKRVAFREMGRVVAGWCNGDDGSSGVGPGAVLKLPLTQDARVLHTAEMSRRYYGLVMAGGY